MDLLELQPTTRSRYTRADLRLRVRQDCAQFDPVFLLDADVDRWADEAVDIIGRDSQWLQYVVTAQTTGGIRDYPLPADCISVSKLMWDIWELECLTLQQLFAAQPLWRRIGPGRPLAYFLGGASRFTLFPTPATASGMTIFYAARPPQPLGDLDTYFVPVGGDEALVYYCSLKAALKDMGREGSKRSAIFASMWEQSLAKIVGQARALGEESAIIFGGARRGFRGSGNVDALWRHVPLPGGG